MYKIILPAWGFSSQVKGCYCCLGFHTPRPTTYCFILGDVGLGGPLLATLETLVTNDWNARGEGIIINLWEPYEMGELFSFRNTKQTLAVKRMQTTSCLFKAMKEESTITQAKRLFCFPSQEWWLKSARKPQRPSPSPALLTPCVFFKKKIPKNKAAPHFLQLAISLELYVYILLRKSQDIICFSVQ